MARRKSSAPAGAPDWIVTFADLMSLLCCFFVLIISFSIQDTQKLQVVAGSMREAFGTRDATRRTGMIEMEGTPVREYIRDVAIDQNDLDSEFANQRHEHRVKQGPELNTHDIEKAENERPREFTAAAESLRQAWQEMPEILQLSDQILVEEDETALNIQIIDQDGRSMFPEGSKYPFERTRSIIGKMGPVLRDLPNRIEIVGHTSSDRSDEKPGYGHWELSADRANMVRMILQEYGVPQDRFAAVTGKADTQPLFPEDSFLAANRRITIRLLSEAPPLPTSHQP
ncbi:MAG: flagellar motor protein MotB [Rhodobiaceae bacterium]|nr:flagellar motor protein MotB [Rhodobiaceae bacterium]MCC0057184.1 flagellar motor protein MotB [Rhodobiaceae bacterium]